MKKLLSTILAFTLVLTLTAPALAAGDVTWSKDTTLTKFINRYNNATVKAGVTLTMKEFEPDPQGLEIVKSLTVEKGGRITGGGSIIFERGATCTGLDLYYRVAGVEKPLTVTLAEVVKSEPSADYRPTFLYDGATGHYVLVANYANDPFEQPQPGDGGSGGEDTRAREIAEALKSLGLFLGVGVRADGTTDFALNRAPSRAEAVTLLVRLLGKDAEAHAYDTSSCPFDDVPDWAKGYVAYAYGNKLTNGVSATKFNSDAPATVQQFETFVLRAMGYSDANGEDFTWDHPEKLAETLGIVLGPSDAENFSRGTCVKIMEIALRNAMKDGTQLYRKLAADGVFTEEQYKAAFGAN